MDHKKVVCKEIEYDCNHIEQVSNKEENLAQSVIYISFVDFVFCICICVIDLETPGSTITPLTCCWSVGLRFVFIFDFCICVLVGHLTLCWWVVFVLYFDVYFYFYLCIYILSTWLSVLLSWLGVERCPFEYPPLPPGWPETPSTSPILIMMMMMMILRMISSWFIDWL